MAGRHLSLAQSIRRIRTLQGWSGVRTPLMVLLALVGSLWRVSHWSEAATHAVSVFNTDMDALSSGSPILEITKITVGKYVINAKVNPDNDDLHAFHTVRCQLIADNGVSPIDLLKAVDVNVVRLARSGVLQVDTMVMPLQLVHAFVPLHGATPMVSLTCESLDAPFPEVSVGRARITAIMSDGLIL